jgi:transposase
MPEGGEKNMTMHETRERLARMRQMRKKAIKAGANEKVIEIFDDEIEVLEESLNELSSKKE